MSQTTPERLGHEILDLCAGCDMCRELMTGTPCLFFPDLFRLIDRTPDDGGEVTSGDMKALVERCNMCGLCACSPVRTKIRNTRDAFVARDGLKPALRLLEDVRLVGKLCGAFPRLANRLLESRPTSSLIKRLAGIHPGRKFPKIPQESFVAWAKARGLDRVRETPGRKVAYFAGCTAQYLFPDVAKATVEVLEHNGVTVYLPEQRCCGMPAMLEGDRGFTFDAAGFNITELTRAIDAGYDIVTACPTCGYMLKSVLSDGAHLSEGYRAYLKGLIAEAGGDINVVQNRFARGETVGTAVRGKPPYPLQLLFGKAYRDEGYFAAIDGLDRLRVSTHTYDLGEYLQGMSQSGEFNRDLGPVLDRMAYYPPCHQKEQEVGTPWMDLLALVPGMAMTTVGGFFDCCGMGGIMGFKKEFHRSSLAMGSRLMKKIKAADPERLVTDCLSCRIQFNQALPYRVLHPVEILNESYRSRIREAEASGEVKPRDGQG